MQDDHSGVFAEMTTAQRLELDAYIAPYLRSASPKTLARRVKLYDAKKPIVDPKQPLEVTGQATGADVLRGLARIQELEHVLAPGVRPTEVACRNCCKLMPVPLKGRIASVCTKGCACPTNGCARLVNRCTALATVAKGRRAICIVCARKQSAERLVKACASLTSEQRSAVGKKAFAALTPAQRAKNAEKLNAGLTHEQRSSRVKKQQAAKTPEQRAEITRKALAKRTPEQRTRSALKREAEKSDAQRAEIGRKISAAKRAKKAAAEQ